jgi:hypothetical protein
MQITNLVVAEAKLLLTSFIPSLLGPTQISRLIIRSVAVTVGGPVEYWILQAEPSNQKSITTIRDMRFLERSFF